MVGDRVGVTEQATGADSSTWYKVHFPKSDARGWIHGNFVSLVSADDASQPFEKTPDYSTSTTSETSPATIYSSSSSSGRCNSPEDVDIRGRRCGGRAASVRRRRR